MDSIEAPPRPRRSRRKRGPSANTVSSLLALVASLALMCVVIFAPMFMHLFPDAWLEWPPYGLFIGLVLGSILFVVLRRTIYRWLMTGS
ncbi:hypothetical protein BH10PSE17_BH10PSE17_00470 [soil metagenome]